MGNENLDLIFLEAGFLLVQLNSLSCILWYWFLTSTDMRATLTILVRNPCLKCSDLGAPFNITHQQKG